MYEATLIPGDGIGPEVVRATTRVLAATGVQISWDVRMAGECAFTDEGNPLPVGTINSIKETRLALKGPTGTPIGGGFTSINVELRKIFKLNTNARPAKSFAGIPSRFSGIDILVFRENIEDFYAGEGRWLDEQHTAAEHTGIITKANCESFFRRGFEYMRKAGRKKAVVGHKGNIIKPMHGLFLDTFNEVAAEYPDIETSGNLIADNLCHQLVRWPEAFDSIFLPNMIGDMVSDLCAGLVGGLGVAPGANLGDDCAIFEAVHGTAPDIAGQNKANPTALILSGAMMLEYLNENAAAKLIYDAVAKILAEGQQVTGDINRTNPVGTDDMAEAIAEEIIISKMAVSKGM